MAKNKVGGDNVSPSEIKAGRAEDARNERMRNQYLKDGYRDLKLAAHKDKVRIKYEKTYEFNKPKKSAGEGTGKVTKIRAAKAGGRAQPKGTPPRTGPGSGSGGQSARYARLTGGLLKHGR